MQWCCRAPARDVVKALIERVWLGGSQQLKRGHFPHSQCRTAGVDQYYEGNRPTHNDFQNGDFSQPWWLYFRWVAHGSHPTKVIKWHNWNEAKRPMKREKSQWEVKLGESLINVRQWKERWQRCVHLWQTLRKNWTGWRCGARSPLDICPLACITSEEKHKVKLKFKKMFSYR